MVAPAAMSLLPLLATLLSCHSSSDSRPWVVEGEFVPAMPAPLVLARIRAGRALNDVVLGAPAASENGSKLCIYMCLESRSALFKSGNSCALPPALRHSLHFLGLSRLEPTERRVQIVAVLFGGRTEYCAFLACSLRGLKHSNSEP
jgi:hypothetical protein